MRASAVMLVFALCIGGPSAAVETGQLSTTGTDFGRINVGATKKALSLSIEINDQDVVATYAVARLQNNAPRKRMESGYWVPWDGQAETLADLGLLPSADGVLTFPLVDEDLSAEFLPITFTVIVRTAEDVRWGYVVIDQ